ncbi:hypothetical protein [Streptomyces sp. NBC_00151]|uniref:hypothetical protein n=1 Tax=Streptomyces sp. NBC_00151 TaxID=2975669 RepID=UPI002DD7D07F|nr:hypothetical protein [Streptomyces sp. NBC_00151]WRZ44549.1 hypothetical protein OG915_45035 [Streptomyces sp. NBC_00151]
MPDLEDFCRLPIERQLSFNHETHRFISWLAVTGRLQLGADYLVARRPRLGIVLARTEPELHLRFMETARTLGFRDYLAMSQFNLLGHFVALFGKQPHELQQTDWGQGRDLLLEAARRIPNRGVKALSTSLFNLEATLFHLVSLQGAPVFGPGVNASPCGAGQGQRNRRQGDSSSP